MIEVNSAWGFGNDSVVSLSGTAPWAQNIKLHGYFKYVLAVLALSIGK